MNEENKNLLLAIKPEELPQVEIDPRSLAKVLVGAMKNLHHAKAHAKTRGEIRGGGRKPWRQKGTGRARAGSIRSPLWKGGGIIFGPQKERNWHVKINKQEKRLALYAILTKKSKAGRVFSLTLDKLPVKTKEALLLLKDLIGQGSILIVLDVEKPEEIRAFRNLPQVTVKRRGSLSPLEAAKYQFIVFEEKILERLKR